MTQKITCPLCQGEKLKLVTQKLRFGKTGDVYRCDSCSLVFLDQNSFTFPKDFYEKEYHQTYLTHVEPDALNPHKYFEKMMKTTLPWANRFKKLIKGNEEVLDVGCSTGHFMELIKNDVKQVYGHELNKKEVEFSKNEKGLDVSGEPLEKRFGDKKFDFITMIFVLEHIGEPKTFLEYLKKFLKPDGKMIILVPNINDALVNFYQIPEFTNFYYCIEHLFYYSQETIKVLFDQAGLFGNIETVQEYPITNHLNWAYRRAPSDVIASRKNVPDVALQPTVDEKSLEALWLKFNDQYKTFLTQHGYGDRVWAEVGHAH